MVPLYIESRGGEYDAVMMAGINVLAQDLAKGVSVQDVFEAQDLINTHFDRDMFNIDDWMYIATELGGKIPLEIRAVREGTVVPTKNVLCTVRTTNPRLMWLAGFFETMILRAIWYPTTVATVSFEAKKVIKRYLEKTCDNPSKELPFKLHDFGARGVSSSESAALGGLAHLYNFNGTDNLEALVAAREIFGVDCAGFNIPAREHSTTTSHQDEDLAFINSINEWGKGTYVMVMDSYDYIDALERVTTGVFKEAIVDMGGTCVLRPDSGNPVDVVMAALRTVERNVGATYNEKGYKVLHPSYRVIQGDGVDVTEIQRILDYMEGRGYSAENVAFGMGGGLLQHSDRDTQRFAMKMSAIQSKWRMASSTEET